MIHESSANGHVGYDGISPLNIWSNECYCIHCMYSSFVKENKDVYLYQFCLMIPISFLLVLEALTKNTFKKIKFTSLWIVHITLEIWACGVKPDPQDIRPRFLLIFSLNLTWVNWQIVLQWGKLLAKSQNSYSNYISIWDKRQEQQAFSLWHSMFFSAIFNCIHVFLIYSFFRPHFQCVKYPSEY